jgi:AraC family transcriptional regulator, transcriptional activator of pobA
MLSYRINTLNTYSSTEFRIFRLNKLYLMENKEKSKGKFHTFIFVSSGSGVLQIDFEEHIAIKNKIFFIERYKYWSWIKIEKLEGYLVQFTDSYYNHIYTGNPKIKSDQTLVGEFPDFIKIEENNKKEWTNILDILMQESFNMQENYKEIICLSLKILIMLFRRNTYTKGKILMPDRKNQTLNEFRKLVNNKFIELKTPKAFALILNITPNYLNALCKEVYNKTVSEIIQERIILEAKRLLAHTGLSVSEISYRLGFKDNSYFGRYFKKVVGIPPEKYRTINYNTLNF